MRFTSEEAFEADDSGEPIMVEWSAVVAICKEHGCLITDNSDPFAGEWSAEFGSQAQAVNAAKLLEWLGY